MARSRLPLESKHESRGVEARSALCIIDGLMVGSLLRPSEPWLSFGVRPSDFRYADLRRAVTCDVVIQ
jgi:hypothetical protein